MQTTISELKKALSPHYDSREVDAIIRLLLEEVCGLTRIDILLHKDRTFPAELQEKMKLYASRLATGEPVQQVLGYEWFQGKPFYVNRHVLIPRPETAELVDWIVGDVPANAPCKILDIGTGSGCIALSIAQQCPQASVTALDVSAEALSVAQANQKNLEVTNVDLVQKDILKEAELEGTPKAEDCYDIIVSNPPYIKHSEMADMDSNVLDFEPHLALFVPDSDPLLFYRAIARYGHKHLKSRGAIYLEINAALGAETCSLLTEEGYTNVELRQDFTGRDRMIRCVAP